MGLLRFNQVLSAGGIDPRDVRLLRHETRRHGLTPYALWRDNVSAFDDYQRLQKKARQAYFSSPVWASFVVTPDARTLFVGCYRATFSGAVPADWIDPISGRDIDSFVDYDLYDTEVIDQFGELAGRLAIDWGTGARSWAQRADNQDKAITELRRSFIEPPFPGFAAFVAQLSEIEVLPPGWRLALSQVRGVYLLTCPRTHEQYVGAATGEDGFIGRWRTYVMDGHGGNVAMRIREPSDYRVSILQVAGSAESIADVQAMEALWKTKLQSREMGLNRN
jgi:hypothetical protein